MANEQTMVQTFSGVPHLDPYPTHIFPCGTTLSPHVPALQSHHAGLSEIAKLPFHWGAHPHVGTDPPAEFIAETPCLA